MSRGAVKEALVEQLAAVDVLLADREAGRWHEGRGAAGPPLRMTFTDFVRRVPEDVIALLIDGGAGRQNLSAVSRQVRAVINCPSRWKEVKAAKADVHANPTTDFLGECLARLVRLDTSQTVKLDLRGLQPIFSCPCAWPFKVEAQQCLTDSPATPVFQNFVEQCLRECPQLQELCLPVPMNGFVGKRWTLREVELHLSSYKFPSPQALIKQAHAVLWRIGEKRSGAIMNGVKNEEILPLHPPCVLLISLKKKVPSRLSAWTHQQTVRLLIDDFAHVSIEALHQRPFPHSLKKSWFPATLPRRARPHDDWSWFSDNCDCDFGDSDDSCTWGGPPDDDRFERLSKVSNSFEKVETCGLMCFDCKSIFCAVVQNPFGENVHKSMLALLR